MMKKIRVHLIVLFNFCCLLVSSQQNNVRLVRSGESHQLIVNEKPFYIKGAGGQQNLDVLVEAGGNTIRTWGTENAEKVLNEAQAKGVKVMLGLWVQHERHGFDYNNQELINKQLEDFKKEVHKYKNHPALLFWCVGNEYELAYKNTKVWKAVNEIAKMIKVEDPFHPVVTVTAGTDDQKINFVKEELTAIDIYGINTYGDINKVKNVLEKAHYDKPYMITEWGPTGHWESPKTSWGVSLEQSSKEKAFSYYNRYQQYIASDSFKCLGSFAFLWGHKQEYTSTWYGVFHENGIKTAVVDALFKCWSPQKQLPNEAPILDSISISPAKNRKDLIIKRNEPVLFEVYCKDLNNDFLSYNWELYYESTDLKIGGDQELKPALVLGKIEKNNLKKCSLIAPNEMGKYRLFVTISDGDKIAYDNIPILVRD